MRATTARSGSALLLCLALLAGPAAAGDAPPTGDSAANFPEVYETELGAKVPDPIEPVNRRLFRFNEKVDAYVFEPVTNAYQFVVPKPVRMCVRRFFRNLRAPVYIANNLLQLRFREAAETLGGFALNSTAGWVGLFDPGSNVGWEQHPADFGQTLGMLGVRSGPYLVIPLLGPSTLRDGVGDIVDRAFDPLTYLLGMGNLFFIGGSSGFVSREASAERLAALRDSSVDHYAAMRSAFTQNRESQIAALRVRFCTGSEPQETASAE